MINKSKIYESLMNNIPVVLEGEDDPIIWMSTLACLVHHTTGHFWVGFYRVQGQELVIGPYQGTLGCIRIPFGKGVCGTCALQQKTVIVPNVHEYPGHIACDSRSNSEIVVPVFDSKKNLKAVLDIDSTRHSMFDTTDQYYLEMIAKMMTRLRWSNSI